MQNSQKALILNVDDDLGGLYACSRLLRLAGYEVAEAASGREALEKVATLKPDLVLLDVRLPDKNGFEVCRAIRAEPATALIPILHMTASYLDADSRVTGLEGGADGYLTEPVEPSVLLATIKSLLRLRMAEKNLRESARQWQTTFDAIGDGLAVLDADGRVVKSNAALSSLLGKAQGELHGRLWNELFACQPGEPALLEKVRASKHREAEEQNVGDATLAITMDPIFGEAGALDGAVCTICDLTERRRFERDLQHTQKLESIGVLAGGVAHDFNNLLTGILGNASLLQDDLDPGDRNRLLVKEIIAASESAAHLTRQLLAYAGKGHFVSIAVDLTQLVLDSKALFQAFIPKNVELRFEAMEQLMIMGDPGQIQQVVMNLVINASESIPAGDPGSIMIKTGVQELSEDFIAGHGGKRVAAPGPHAFLEISDTGCGMDFETKSRIFDPFFTTKFTGRGLGLSAVQGIVRAHNGIVIVESEPSRGTTFRLLFPRAAAEVSLPKADAAPVPSHGFGTILVVDDENTVRQTATAMLKRNGYGVLTAENGFAAVEIFRRNPTEINAVVLDLTMTGMNGEQTLEALQEIRQDVPVLLSSGYSKDSVQERFSGKQVAAFLQKPYTAATLIQALTSALASVA